MGDRCYMEVYCRKENANVFEDMGFNEETVNYSDVPGLIHMVDMEANYAHWGDMPTNIPYHGHHGNGGGYNATCFACDGKELVDVVCLDSGDIVVGVSTNGGVRKKELDLVKKYLKTEAIAKLMLGYPPPKGKVLKDAVPPGKKSKR